LNWLWQRAGAPASAPTAVALDDLLAPDVAASLDHFDRLQLEAVVRVCRSAGSLSEAGRQLFDRSRMQRAVVNDADRLRKYLLKFGLAWAAVVGPTAAPLSP